MSIFTAFPEIDADVKAIYEKNMAEAFKVLMAASKARYGKHKVLALRKEYKGFVSSGNRQALMSFTQDVHRVMKWMMEHETAVLQMYLGVGFELINAFANTCKDRPGLSADDFEQEAGFAIYDAMYLYNGSNCFSTYVYYSVKNRLIKFSKKDQRLSGLSLSIQKLRARIRRIMHSENVDFSEAVLIYDKTEKAKIEKDNVGKPKNERIKFKALSPLMISRVRDAMFSIQSVSDESVIVQKQADTEPIALSMIVPKANLNQLELSLVQAKLSGDTKFREKEAARLKISKQRLSQVYLDACKKIKAAYNVEVNSVA